ncbi:hypothetical protein FRC17_000960 [Serendipita sp. 399]|nr:hypothetical protein FRC17_000960 [Serendipita sp. 399]
MTTQVNIALTPNSTKQNEGVFLNLYSKRLRAKCQHELNNLCSMLSTALIYSAISTAVIAATLVESLPKEEAQYAKRTTEILYYISLQLSNVTDSNYTKHPPDIKYEDHPFYESFIIPCFFGSLYASLLAGAISYFTLYFLQHCVLPHLQDQSYRIQSQEIHNKITRAHAISEIIPYLIFASTIIYLPALVMWTFPNTEIGQAVATAGVIVTVTVLIVVWLVFVASSDDNPLNCLSEQSINSSGGHPPMTWLIINRFMSLLDSSITSMQQISIVLDLIAFNNLLQAGETASISLADSVWKEMRRKVFSNEYPPIAEKEGSWDEEVTIVLGKLARAFQKGQRMGSVRQHFLQEFRPLEEIQMLDDVSLGQCAQLAQWGLFPHDSDRRFRPVEELLKLSSAESDVPTSGLDKQLLPLGLYYLDRQQPERNERWTRYLDSFAFALTIPPDSLTSTATLSYSGLEAGLRILTRQLTLYTSPLDSFLLEDLSLNEVDAIKNFALSLILQFTAKLASLHTEESVSYVFDRLVGLLYMYPMTRQEWLEHRTCQFYPRHCLRKVPFIPRIHEVLNQMVLAKERIPNHRLSILMEYGETLVIGEQITYGPGRNPVDKVAETLHILDTLIQGGCSDQEHISLIALSIQVLQSYSRTFIQRYISNGCSTILLQIQDPSLRLVAGRMAGITCYIPPLSSVLWDRLAWKAALEYWFRMHTGSPTRLDQIFFEVGLLQLNRQIHRVLIDATTAYPFLKAEVFELLEFHPDETTEASSDTIVRHLHLRDAPWFKELLEEADRVDYLLDKISTTPPFALTVEGVILPSQSTINEIVEIFEHLPPGAMNAVRNMEASNPLQARVILRRVDRIIRILREAEDVSRTLLPWNNSRSSCFQML